MNPGFPYYMPSGIPATGYFTVSSVPATNITVTVGTRTYTFNTDFFGDNVSKIVQSLTAAINADRNRLSLSRVSTTNSNPVNTVFASYAGNIVFIVSTVPGVIGNTIAIAVDSGTAITANLDFLTGGVAANTDVGVRGSASGLKTSQTSLAANANRMFWGIINTNNAALVAKLAAGASGSDFDIPLQASSAVDAGNGGYYFDSTYQGVVSVYNSGASYRYTFIEILKA